MRRYPEAMTKRAPSLGDLMTDSPATIGLSATISDAAHLMNSLEIRHLPVVNAAGEVEGVLSKRDLALLDALEALDAGTLPVSVAMSKRPFTASPDTPIDRVATEMADRKLGSCVAVEGGEVVGVFTTVDACRALAAAHASEG